MEGITSREKLLDDETFMSLFDIEDLVLREQHKQKLEDLSIQLKCRTAFRNLYKAYLKENNKINPVCYDVSLMIDEKGRVLNTIHNFKNILEHDPAFSGRIKFNEMSQKIEVLKDSKMHVWGNIDDSKCRSYIEKKYGIYSENKMNDALIQVCENHSYNPLKDKIQSIEWDGKDRINTMLHKWMKCEDNEYTREVSRLIFAGGINRLYNEGCKFDEMPVLIGTRQGGGKSTFISLLAMDDAYFKEIKDIEGAKGVEAIEGGWICEMAELLAMTRQKEQEAIKAYITCRVDKYRKPYERRPSEYPRRCIFIGTTNKEQFLSDITGNRRFYPVKTHSRGHELFSNMKELKNDIEQSWAEAYLLFTQNKLPPVANHEMESMFLKEQQDSMEDDWRVELISEYLKGKDSTCILQLWSFALKMDSKPSKKDSSEIALILTNILGWSNTKKAKKFSQIGVQKEYKLLKIIQTSVDNEDDFPF